MYTIRMDLDPRLRTNTALRAYARTEYGDADAAWFLAAALRRSRSLPRKRLVARVPLFRTRPQPRALPHKGAPRLDPSETAASG